MPMYTGSTADGSDMKEVEGMYVNPDNPEEWSSQMYPKQRQAQRVYMDIVTYMSNHELEIKEVRQEIIDKKCGLSKRLRDYVMGLFDKEGNFIERDNDEKDKGEATVS